MAACVEASRWYGLVLVCCSATQWPGVCNLEHGNRDASVATLAGTAAAWALLVEFWLHGGAPGHLTARRVSEDVSAWYKRWPSGQDILRRPMAMRGTTSPTRHQASSAELPAANRTHHLHRRTSTQTKISGSILMLDCVERQDACMLGKSNGCVLLTWLCMGSPRRQHIYHNNMCTESARASLAADAQRDQEI